MIVVYTFHRLSITCPEGAKFVVCPSPGESGEVAFGRPGDMKTYGGVSVAGVPWGIAHALPFIYG